MLEIRNKRLASLLLFMSALLWSTSGIFTKSVEWNGLFLGEKLTPLSLAGCAIVIGTLLVYHVRSARTK